jgi:hypothetical protein
MANQKWAYKNFTAKEGPLAATIFLDEYPRQGPGEASATVRGDGSVTLFYLEPGSRGSDTSRKWAFVEFSGSQATQDEVNFLNNSPRLGPGEASAGTVGVLYFEGGSLGSLTSPTWVYQNFPAGNGPGQGPGGAVYNLNGAPRQGAGEVCAIARNDGSLGGENGSVGVFSLQPGSISFMSSPSWQYRNFTPDEGPQAVVDFLNKAPQKDPGEATAWAREDGSVGLFYLEHGTG